MSFTDRRNIEGQVIADTKEEAITRLKTNEHFAKQLNFSIDRLDLEGSLADFAADNGDNNKKETNNNGI